MNGKISREDWFGSPAWFLGVGLLLLVGYFIIAAAFSYFVDPDLNYLGTQSSQALGSIRRYQDRDFSKHHLLSVMWKSILLLPATLSLVFYLAFRVPREKLDKLMNRAERLPVRRVLAVAMLLLLVLLILISHVVFRQQPVYDDERAYEFQARVLATGHVAMPPPPAPACFENMWIIIKDGRWLGKYTGGQSVAILAGRLLGSPYLAIFLMAMGTPLLVYSIGKQLYEPKVGLIAALLFVVSPAYLFTSATLMNHATTLFFLALFTWAYLRTSSECAWGYPVLAGLALGCALNIRPQDAAGYGAAFAICSGLRLIKHRRLGVWGRHALILFGFAIPLVLFFLYNKAATGDMLLTPFRSYRPAGRLAFGSIEGRAYVHTPFMAAAHLLINYARMNLWLFGWPLSMIFVISYFVRGRFVPQDRMLLAAVVTVSGFYLLSTVAGVAELGARYYFSLLIPLMLWSANEMLDLHRRFARAFDGKSLNGAIIIPAFVILSLFLATVTFAAERILHFRALSARVEEPYKTVEAAGVSNAIVQIYSLPPSGWVFGYRMPDPDLNDDVLYVRAKKAADLLELLDAMPERTLYALMYDFDEDKILFGPLPRSAVVEMTRDQADEDME